MRTNIYLNFMLHVFISPEAPVISLRLFQEGDEFSLARHINNKKIHDATAEIPYPYSIKDAENWLKTVKENESLFGKPLDFAISNDSLEEVIGGISVKRTNAQDTEKEMRENGAEIGYWLSESYWGRNIMTKALEIITEYAFRELELSKLEGQVLSWNKSSARVLEKNAYKLSKVLENARCGSKECQSVLVYSRLNTAVLTS